MCMKEITEACVCVYVINQVCVMQDAKWVVVNTGADRGPQLISVSPEKVPG